LEKDHYVSGGLSIHRDPLEWEQVLVVLRIFRDIFSITRKSMSRHGNRISDFTEKISAICVICGRKKIF